MDYYYVPQNAWGLLDEDFSSANGLYSESGGSCTPVALYCKDTRRLMFTHSDENGGTPLSVELAQWLTDLNMSNIIEISASNDNDRNIYITKINNLTTEQGAVFQGQIGSVQNANVFWCCSLSSTTNEPLWVDFGSEVTGITLPVSYNYAFPNINITLQSYIISNNESPCVTSLNTTFWLSEGPQET